ncbi:MAG TPA: NAD(P)/FAD-dependent oxidoreductase [Burkholderiales bacterium]|nr:NAD(P)/FAD-dependent oxidoreductase [Burkholderiales bacterium]
MNKKSYDLVVIGTGTAAQAAASRCRAEGWRVAIVDHQPFGGTCALRGCDPKKVLVGVAEVLDHRRRLNGKGLAGGAAIDWGELMAFKRTFTDPLPASLEESFAKKGIDAFHGRARFAGERAVEVEGETLEARFVLLACGAAPAKLGFPGEEHLASSTAFMELAALPRRIVFVGGGYIACEFSHVAERAGAHVTVLQQGGRLLPPFDADLVAILTERTRALGIDVRLGTAVERVEKKGAVFVVRAKAKGEPVSLEADLVVHAAGRVPDLGTLRLEQARVETAKGRPKLNEYLQSVSNAAVYAAGDAAASGPPLTPVAGYDGAIAAENMIKGNRRKPSYRGVPSVCFTVPPIAAVGLSEAQARKQGLEFRVKSEKASGWYTARQSAEPAYGFKVLVEKGSDRILGAHLIGPHADEVINLFALAIRQGIAAGALEDTLFAYPTSTSDIKYML